MDECYLNNYIGKKIGISLSTMIKISTYYCEKTFEMYEVHHIKLLSSECSGIWIEDKVPAYIVDNSNAVIEYIPISIFIKWDNINFIVTNGDNYDNDLRHYFWLPEEDTLEVQFRIIKNDICDSIITQEMDAEKLIEVMEQGYILFNNRKYIPKFIRILGGYRNLNSRENAVMLIDLCENNQTDDK